MNVNDAYELQRTNPTDENYALLHNAVREYAWRIGRSLFSEFDESMYRHATENAASDVFLYFPEKFDESKASFSSWAYMNIRGDLLDWRRKRLRRSECNLDDQGLDERTIGSFDDLRVIEAKLALEGFLGTLTEDEKHICAIKFRLPLDYPYSHLNMSLATVKRRWDGILEKARNYSPTRSPKRVTKVKISRSSSTRGASKKRTH